MIRRIALAFIATVSLVSFLPANAVTASAVEIDFAAKLLDLDGKPYRDCAKLNRTDPNDVKCEEWVEHTLGIIAYSALDRPDPREQNVSVIEQARRAVLARKIYPGKAETHVVDLSAAEITLIVDQIAKLQLRPVEVMRAIELLDPARLKQK